MEAVKRIIVGVAIIFLSIITSIQGEGSRVWFGETDDGHVIDQDYEAHNIFVVNGTSVSLENGIITAPDSSDDGEDAVRVEDATFHAKQGTISGGLGVGGSGITISTTRDSEYPPGQATFEAGVEVYGGDAVREKTTKGGDAVQVLQAGSSATFNGGKFVPGMGCTVKACGTLTSDGVAIQVIQGEAIVKGGTFGGVFYNSQGDIEVHGCLEYDKDAGKITGILLDGSEIDVVYQQPNGQDRAPKIISYPEKCAPSVAPENSNAGGGEKGFFVLLSANVVGGVMVMLI